GPRDGGPVDDSTVLEHEADGPTDLSRIDVLLDDAVDARQAIGREAGPSGLGAQDCRGDDEQHEGCSMSALKGGIAWHEAIPLLDGSLEAAIGNEPEQRHETIAGVGDPRPDESQEDRRP